MKRLLPFIVLLLLLLGGIIAVPVLLSPERRRAEITDMLSKAFKRPVVVGALSMGYFPPTLQIGQLAVMKDGGTPALQIENTAAPLDWVALFHLKFVPVELELTHWTLTILRKADGRWDLDDWFSGVPELPAGTSAGLRQVSWKEGEIHWADHAGSVPQELVLGSIEGRWSPAGASFNTSGSFSGLSSTARLTFNAKGQFFSAPQWAGDLELTDQSNSAAFHIDDKAGTFDIKGGSPQWRLASALAFLKFYGRGAANTTDSSNPLMLDHWQTHVSGTSARFSFEYAAGISGGLSEVNGSVEAQPSGLLARAEGAVKDVPAEVLASVLGENLPLTGKVTGIAKDLTMVLSAKPLSTFGGQGYWELKDGRYKIPASSLQSLAKARTMNYLKKKFPDLEQNGLPVNKLSAHWQAQDGFISVSDGLFVSTDLKAGWTVKLDADRRGLDGYLRLRIHEPDPKLAALIPPSYRAQPAFGHVQGAWQDWSVRSVRPSKIPSAIQAQLRQAVAQK